MKRRRFLSLAAAFACAPRFALADSWTGRAFGAEMSLTLHGPREETAPILADLPGWLDAFEQEFSLYRPNSALNRLNQSGFLAGSARFHTLMDHVQDAHDLTEGLFDPTVQPLWQAYAQGKTPSPAQSRIGWHNIQRQSQAIQLAQGQQLTLNGIAQGFATDLIRDHLRRRGFTRALVNLGEFAALGGPFRLGLQDPRFRPSRPAQPDRSRHRDLVTRRPASGAAVPYPRPGWSPAALVHGQHRSGQRHARGCPVHGGGLHAP